MVEQQQCRKEKEGQIFTVWWQPTCLVSCLGERVTTTLLFFCLLPLLLPLGDESECAVRVKIRV